MTTIMVANMVRFLLVLLFRWLNWVFLRNFNWNNLGDSGLYLRNAAAINVVGYLASAMWAEECQGWNL